MSRNKEEIDPLIRAFEELMKLKGNDVKSEVISVPETSFRFPLTPTTAWLRTNQLLG